MVHVLGDVFIDEYRFLKPIRLSAEAPVPICTNIRTECRPGGAGNVAANIASMIGAENVKLYAVMPKDAYEEIAIDGIDNSCVVSHLPVLRKIRYLTEDGHQFFREDHEIPFNSHWQVSNFLLDVLCQKFKPGDTIVISDYGRGSIPAKLRLLLSDSNAWQGKIIVNCKPWQIGDYSHASLLVLNQHEASEYIKQFSDDREPKDLPVGLVNYSGGHADVLVTCGADGMYYATPNWDEAQHIPATPVPGVVDVTGAGDTVVATLAAYHKSANFQGVLHQAARNAASVVQQVGVAVPR